MCHNAYSLLCMYAASSESSHDSISTSTTASYQSAASVAEPISTSFDKFQEDLFEIVNTVDTKCLALALVSESSQKKCPYLDRSARQKIYSFLETARSSSDNFTGNYEIIADVFDIAKRFPGYISAVQAALGKCFYHPRD